jgi:hypothetical protein
VATATDRTKLLQRAILHFMTVALPANDAKFFASRTSRTKHVIHQPIKGGACEQAFISRAYVEWLTCLEMKGTREKGTPRRAAEAAATIRMRDRMILLLEIPY